MKRLFKLLRLGVLTWAAGFVALLGVQVFWPADAAPPEPADAIVCLGAGMSYQGWELPDSASTRRARTCADLYAAGVAPVVIFTGYGHAVSSAARAMSEVARAEGLPRQAALIEPRAKSTIQNAVFSLNMLETPPQRVVVVSDPFHLPRSWAIFRIFGEVPDVSVYAAADTEDRGRGERREVEWVFRESFAVWSNLGRLVAYWAGGLAGVDRATRIGWFN
ncbi:YdcF family protein [Roseibacterium sp. SDUM158016]|uniref:YdcF family protein n=1 Tax=Roseicyclus sediminis TaxID=2980997 RepID=UPI0021D0FD58|nr:YdcF family protein [Roseibacterium sp. SDUM158016]MCU4651849.1 YdcF family protein [Roseibacterium sp. SDUM158016]